MVSQKLMLDCFPDIESILHNISEGIYLNQKSDDFTTVSRLEWCLHYLRNKNYDIAAQYAVKAGYNTMSQAILFHCLGV